MAERTKKTVTANELCVLIANAKENGKIVCVGSDVDEYLIRVFEDSPELASYINSTVNHRRQLEKDQVVVIDPNHFSVVNGQSLIPPGGSYFDEYSRSSCEPNPCRDH